MSNTEKWLIKYDSIWNEINNKPIFQSYLILKIMKFVS